MAKDTKKITPKLNTVDARRLARAEALAKATDTKKEK